MKSKSKGPIPEYLDALQPDIPEPDPPDTPAMQAVKKGAKWGAVAGFVVAQLILQSQTVETPVGTVNTGNILLVYGVCLGLGALIGAALGSLSKSGREDSEKPPTGPKES